MGRFAVIVLALLMAMAGAGLVWGGSVLILHGGSWYYLLAGLALAASGWGLFRKQTYAFPLFGALLGGTLVWALWEAGLDGWALVPRLIAPGVLGLILLLPSVRTHGEQTDVRWVSWPTKALALLMILLVPMGSNPFNTNPLAFGMGASNLRPGETGLEDARVEALGQNSRRQPFLEPAADHHEQCRKASAGLELQIRCRARRLPFLPGDAAGG